MRTDDQAEQARTQETNKRREQHDLTLPSWIAILLSTVSVVAQSGLNPSNSDINEFAAIFGLLLIILTTVGIVMSPARRAVHCAFMLWVWVLTGTWIVGWRFFVQLHMLPAAESRLYVGWGYAVLAGILVVGINRLRIKRWLTGP